eukprot:2358276-Amphidinium_carterae.1
MLQHVATAHPTPPQKSQSCTTFEWFTDSARLSTHSWLNSSPLPSRVHAAAFSRTTVCHGPLVLPQVGAVALFGHRSAGTGLRCDAILHRDPPKGTLFLAQAAIFANLSASSLPFHASHNGFFFVGCVVCDLILVRYDNPNFCYGTSASSQSLLSRLVVQPGLAGLHTRQAPVPAAHRISCCTTSCPKEVLDDVKSFRSHRRDMKCAKTNDLVGTLFSTLSRRADMRSLFRANHSASKVVSHGVSLLRRGHAKREILTKRTRLTAHAKCLDANFLERQNVIVQLGLCCRALPHSE